MPFIVGQRVRMKRTENYGEVTRVLPGDIYQVKLEGGLGHLPLPEEAIELPPPQFKPAPKPKLASVAPVGKEYAQDGVQLAFDAQLNNQAEPVAYEVYLLNGTDQKIIYELKVLTHGDRRWSKAGVLEAGGKKRLEAVDYGWLNEKLSCELDVRVVLVGGTGPRHFQQVRIKGSQFFARLTDVPALYREAHLYTVFPVLDQQRTAPASAPPASSLMAITRAQLQQRPKRDDSKRKVENDLREKLEFEEQIDLHLDKLVEDPDKVPKHQVLQTQLMHYDNYIDRALRLGVDSVFIIHGVGTGALKRAIHSRLHRTKFVREFKNEYHAKYGYGATEVIFD
ncbi:MAG: Smr/MutS family protein [Bacteroidota bacterium]